MKHLPARARHPAGMAQFSDSLRRAAARGAGTVEIEGMARARLHIFLAQELARARAWAFGQLARAGVALAAGPGKRHGD